MVNFIYSDGISKLITLFDVEYNFFVDVTEYQVVRYLKMNVSDLVLKPCINCGSTDLELTDVKIGDPLFQSEQLFSIY